MKPSTLSFSGPSRPSSALLASSAPPYAWDAAIHQANRSPMIRFKVGAALFHPNREEIIGKGCSHPDIQHSKALASIHAERHAIHNVYRKSDLEGGWICIYTFGRRGGCAWSSRPCYSCAHSLYRAGIERVLYAERTGSGRWIVKGEHPEELLIRATNKIGLYARELRIV